MTAFRNLPVYFFLVSLLFAACASLNHARQILPDINVLTQANDQHKTLVYSHLNYIKSEQGVRIRTVPINNLSQIKIHKILINRRIHIWHNN